MRLKFQNKNSIDWQLMNKNCPFKLKRKTLDIVSWEVGNVINVKTNPNIISSQGGVVTISFTGETFAIYSDGTRKKYYGYFKFNEKIYKNNTTSARTISKVHDYIVRGNNANDKVAIDLGWEYTPINKCTFHVSWNVEQEGEKEHIITSTYEVENVTSPIVDANAISAKVSYNIRRNVNDSIYGESSYLEVYKKKETVTFPQNYTYEDKIINRNLLYTPRHETDVTPIIIPCTITQLGIPRPHYTFYGYIPCGDGFEISGLTYNDIIVNEIQETVTRVDEYPSKNITVEAPFNNNDGIKSYFIFTLVEDGKEVRYYDGFDYYQFEENTVNSNSVNGDILITSTSNDETRYKLYGRVVRCTPKYNEQIIFSFN